MTMKAPITATDMQRDIIAALRYPAQPAALTMLVALALGMLLTIVPLAGFLIQLVIWAAAYHYAVEVFERSANGSQAAPEFAIEQDGIGWALLILQALLLVAQAWLNYRVETAGLRWLGIALIACVQPAMTMATAMNRDIGSAFNPGRVQRVMSGLGAAYALLIVAGVGLGAVQHMMGSVIAGGRSYVLLVVLGIGLGGAQQVLGALAGNWLLVLIGQILAGFVWFYAIVVYFNAMGRAIFAHSDALGFIPIFPDTPLRPEDRHAPLLLRVDHLVAAGNHAGAARELQLCLATELHASPAMHARYRALLAKIDDQGGLLAHAKTRISALLVAGNEREALALLRDSLARDPQFRPAAAEDTTRLARAAESHSQYDLAITLLQDFVTRNPYNFNGVANAVSAAKLMLERRSDVAGARAALQGAMDRFLPAHPHYAELLQELAKLDQLARRLSGNASTTKRRNS